jgi:hypothetical protein
MKPKPILFLISPDGTIGDRKPLAILAVLAAFASLEPVTLCFPKLVEESFSFLEKFARFLMGSHYEQKLIINRFATFNEYHNFIKTQLNNYCVFSQGTSVFNPGYGILLDFGDNLGTNRFTSSLLTYNRQNSTFFGSVYLPKIGIFWSKHSLKKIQTFRNIHNNKQIMLILGSLQPVFPMESVIQWLEKNPNTNWRFMIKTDESVTHPFILGFEEYYELEDLMEFVDFVVTNCGAGSITVPMAYGIPQSCNWIGYQIDGSDKPWNANMIGQLLRVGPEMMLESGRKLSFFGLMNQVNENFNNYKEAALQVQKQMQFEMKLFLSHVNAFFIRLSYDIELQSEVELSNQIPKTFSLLNEQ